MGMKAKENCKPLACKIDEEDATIVSPLAATNTTKRISVKQEPITEDSKNILYPRTRRSARLSTIVKTEDCKTEPCNSSDDVEMEDNQDLQPDEHDPNNYCCVCNKEYSLRDSYRHHLRRVHHMKIGRPQSVRNPHVMPDKDDPNNYCKSCKRTFCAKCSYQQHLRIVHKMTLTRKIYKLRQQPNPHIIPDKNDPNNHCKSCTHTFNSRASYYYHLRWTHNMTPTAKSRIKIRSNPLIVPDKNDHNNHCRSCIWTYSTKSNYYGHLRIVHNMTTTPKKSQPNPFIKPDKNDLNNHCKSCNRDYISRSKYLRHLRAIHKIWIRPPQIISRNPQILPDRNDPNNYCKSCDKSYSSRVTFRYHLRTFHGMTLRVSKNDNHQSQMA